MDTERGDDAAGGKPAMRYIKLGPNNCWAAQAFQRGELPFSFCEVPHELALSGDEDAITAHLMAQGKAGGAARNAARQVCSFYGLGAEAIWITFADGMMWWTRAEPEVTWLGESADYAPRMRRSAGGWKNVNRFDVRLLRALPRVLAVLISERRTLQQMYQDIDYE